MILRSYRITSVTGSVRHDVLISAFLLLLTLWRLHHMTTFGKLRFHTILSCVSICNPCHAIAFLVMLWLFWWFYTQRRLSVSFVWLYHLTASDDGFLFLWRCLKQYILHKLVHSDRDSLRSRAPIYLVCPSAPFLFVFKLHWDSHTYNESKSLH